MGGGDGGRGTLGACDVGGGRPAQELPGSGEGGAPTWCRPQARPIPEAAGVPVGCGGSRRVALCSLGLRAVSLGPPDMRWPPSPHAWVQAV